MRRNFSRYMPALPAVALATVAALAATAGHAAAQSRPAISGLASYYDKNYAGKTAAGERYDGAKFTAAHRTLPFGTRLVVTDKRSKRSVTVTVNDRGPFIKGRILDLSYAAATALKMQTRGIIPVSAVIEEKPIKTAADTPAN